MAVSQRTRVHFHVYVTGDLVKISLRINEGKVEEDRVFCAVHGRLDKPRTRRRSRVPLITVSECACSAGDNAKTSERTIMVTCHCCLISIWSFCTHNTSIQKHFNTLPAPSVSVTTAPFSQAPAALLSKENVAEANGTHTTRTATTQVHMRALILLLDVAPIMVHSHILH